jgi:hypothetical protein
MDTNLKLTVTFPTEHELESWAHPVRFGGKARVGGRFSRRRLFRSTDPFNRLMSASGSAVKCRETLDP